jgi:ribosomal protein S18 acetylase RimI-like enzyme
MSTAIRPLSIADYYDILKLWSLAGLPHKPLGRDSRESMAREMALPISRYFGMFENDTMLGVIIANYDGRRGWLNRLAIHPEYRGQRLAGELIREAEAFLEELGAVVNCGLIEEMNTPSMACFERAGYVCETTIRYFTKRKSKLS